MPALKNSAGAFDLPSIITGVVVVGILTAGVLAAIFGVIPFTQDNSAKQDLSSIRTAEGVARAKDNRFMDHQGLLDTGYLQLSSTAATKVKADEKGTCYVALAKSGTGKTFYSTDARTDPELFEADTDTGCLTAEELAELIEDVGGIEDDTPEGAPKNLKLTAVSPLQAKATWDPVKGATGYTVEYRSGNGEWKTANEDWPIAATNAIHALPEETVTVHVYAEMGRGNKTEASVSTLKMPDSVLKNPSFELGTDSWAMGNSYAAVVEGTAHVGTKSLMSSWRDQGAQQVVTVPSDTPILTYWSTAQTTVTVSGTIVSNHDAGVSDGKWSQRKVDLSAYIGKAITLKLTGVGTGSKTYLDDIAFEALMMPDAPMTIGASSRLGAATVTWSAPGFAGGRPVTSYTVEAWSGAELQDSVDVAGGQYSAILSGLQSGREYTITVTARNEIGQSGKSDKYGPVMILDTTIANPGFEHGTSGWTNYGYGGISPEKSRGGSHSFKADQHFSNVLQTGLAQTVTVPRDKPVFTYWGTAPGVIRASKTVVTSTAGAVEGEWTQYKVDLRGYADTSITLNLAAPRAIAGYYDDLSFEAPMEPSAPSQTIAVTSSGTAAVTWSAPTFSGGVPLTSYVVTAWHEGAAKTTVRVSAGVGRAVLTDLSVGASYTFTVAAVNEVGSSVHSLGYGPLEILKDAVANPSFEQGPAGWILTGSILVEDPHAGKSAVQVDYRGSVSQTVTVPWDKTQLTLWVSNSVTASPTLKVDGTSVAMPETMAGVPWAQHQADLSAYAGKTVTISIGQVGFNVATVDDISFTGR